jgi:ribosomal protein S3
LRQDELIRNYLFVRFPEIVQVKIERTETELIISVFSPNTSLITGESNENLDVVLSKITQIVNDQKIAIKLYLENVHWVSAQKIANDLAKQLENRVPCALALRTVTQGIRNFAVCINGTIDKVQIAQTKKISQGKMSSNTLDSLIDESRKTEAKTERGQIGITVQVYKGESKRKKIKYVNFNT